MDVDKTVRSAVESGKVMFGARGGMRGAGKAGAKLVLIAANCPAETRKDIEKACAKAGVPVATYGGTSAELGAACGKPFSVSVLSVLEAGTSEIMELAKK